MLSSGVLGAVVETSCKSTTGLSKYDLSLDTQNKKGSIRYRFMDQDIDYLVGIKSFENGVVSGVAIFNKSRTGEKRGNPFDFKYDLKTETYSELNVTAKCK
jgi:hypothetical protein